MEGSVRRTGVPEKIGNSSAWTVQCAITRKRTASHDRVLEWETPAKKRRVGQPVNGAGGKLKKIALGSRLSNFTSNLVSTVAICGVSGGRSTCDGGDEDSQGWNEGENPHSL